MPAKLGLTTTASKCAPSPVTSTCVTARPLRIDSSMEPGSTISPLGAVRLDQLRHAVELRERHQVRGKVGEDERLAAAQRLAAPLEQQRDGGGGHAGNRGEIDGEALGKGAAPGGLHASGQHARNGFV